MGETSLSGAPSTEGEDEEPQVGGRGDLADRARKERELAALDLTDAEQAEGGSPPQSDIAAELYASADRHRRLAEEIEAAQAEAGPDAETIQPALPAEEQI